MSSVKSSAVGVVPSQSPNANVAPVTTAAPSGGNWKKDFSMTDFTIGMVVGTAFLFLAVVDYSYDQYIMEHLTPHTTNVNNPFVRSLGTYYSWRLSGTPILKFWELFIVCLLPLMVAGLVKNNVDTLRGVRAPAGRHLLDAESFAQLIAVITIIVTKAKPTTQKIIAIIESGVTDPKQDAILYGEIANLLNYHFLIMMLNVLQWFVPLLRLVFQRKQDAIRHREATVADALAQRAAEKEAKAAARALEKAKASLPTAEEMKKRMEEAESLMNSTEQDAVVETELKKRNVAK